jgi:hypothetical protein
MCLYLISISSKDVVQCVSIFYLHEDTQRIVASLGMIEERRSSHNIDQFTYEHILRDTSWLSDYGWMINESKRVE